VADSIVEALEVRTMYKAVQNTRREVGRAGRCLTNAQGAMVVRDEQCTPLVLDPSGSGLPPLAVGSLLSHC
jgi:hypothetical protein